MVVDIFLQINFTSAMYKNYDDKMAWNTIMTLSNYCDDRMAWNTTNGIRNYGTDKMAGNTINNIKKLWW